VVREPRDHRGQEHTGGDPGVPELPDRLQPLGEAGVQGGGGEGHPDRVVAGQLAVLIWRRTIWATEGRTGVLHFGGLGGVPKGTPSGSRTGPGSGLAFNT